MTSVLTTSVTATVVFHAGTWLCGLPLGSVVETMRPLAVQSLPGLPSFVLGLSVIRGVPTPVVDVSALLRGAAVDAPTASVGRFVTVLAGGRPVALAVSSVVGVRGLESAALRACPPMLGGASAGVIEAVGTLDAELLVVLRAGRLVPEEAWDTIDGSP